MKLLVADTTKKDPRSDVSMKSIKKKDKSFVIDLIAAIRTMTKFIGDLPKGYNRIDIAADTYRSNSIKGAKRNERGKDQKVMIASKESIFPYNFGDFMRNGENKTKLVELMSEVTRSNYQRVLQTTNCLKVYFSQEGVTYCLSRTGVTISEDLSSDQEEADTKVIPHCSHVLKENPEAKVILRSPSADTDIFVLAACLLNPTKIFLYYGKGKTRKGFWTCNLGKDAVKYKTSLSGFHAFTGNDYISSSFFKEGKSTCFNKMKKNRNFVEAFRRLGESWDLEEETQNYLERFVCALYGYAKETSVNVVRAKMFEKKYTKSGKIIDMAMLPPCQSVLIPHSKRANYVSKLWKTSLISWLTRRYYRKWLVERRIYNLG